MRRSSTAMASRLFFSSNGHATMGGYDIFKTTLVDADMNGWSLPENMGYPLNTVNDDIYFSLSADGFTGYFSSERPGGLGQQDIYEVVFPGSQLDHVVVRGLVADASEEPVKARILVTDELSEEVVGVFNSNERTGRFLLVLQPGQQYNLTVEAPGYLVQRSILKAQLGADGSNETAMDIVLLPSEAHERLTRHE
jgi:hypothetical protein